MFRNVVSFTLIGAALVACRPADTPVTDDQRTAAVTEVTQTLDDLFSAMNAHDGDGVLSFYRDDPDLAYVGLIQPIVGKAAFSRAAGPFYDREPDVTFEHTVLHIQVLSPTVAVTVTTGSSTKTESIVWTHVLVKNPDGRWMIAHEHEAWPSCVEVKTVEEHPGM
jgi:uncharacterized protein (TIGR02246 family)